MIDHKLWKIVVVDDSSDLAEMAAAVLEMRGFAVAWFDRPAVALEHLRTKEADLVLLDVEMPVVDGYAVALTLRKDSATKDLMIAFHSGLPRDVVERRFRHHDVLLTKPLIDQHLVAAVERLICDRMSTPSGRAKVAEPEGHWISLYTSTIALNGDAAMVDEIMRVAELRNARAGITGAMVFDGARVVQLLEGPLDVLDLLHERLRRDDRHSSFQLLTHASAVGRKRFQTSPMGFHRLGPEDVGIRSIDGLRDEMALDAFDELLPTRSTRAGSVSRPRARAALRA